MRPESAKFRSGRFDVPGVTDELGVSGGAVFRLVLGVAFGVATLAYVALIGFDPGFIRTCPIDSNLWTWCRFVYAGSVPLIVGGLAISIALVASAPRRR